jgi:hypothetical protein
MSTSMIGRAVRRELSLRGSALLVSLLAIASPVVAQTPGAVTGVVDVAGPDKKPFVVPGVTLTLTCPATPAGATQPNVRVAVTDADGAYRIQEVAPGSCSIVAELQGFQSTTTTVTIEEDRTVDVALRLGFNTLREDVTVIANAATAPETSGPSSARLDRATLQTAPIANERFQDALPLVPGVVRGPDGLLNINGSRSNQAGLTLNNASGTDPVTGEFALEVPIDAIQSVNLQQTAYAPEFGQSGGAMATIETQQGGEAWRVQLNNFMPRVRRRGGKIRGLESFTPRLTTGGPIVKGRLTALGAVQYGLTRTRVESLPALESDTEQEGIDGFTRFDWKAADSHQVSWMGVVSPRTQRYAGLNTFNPQRVTPSLDTDGTLFTIGDQILARGNGVLDVRVSYKQFDVTVYPSHLGDEMILAPDTNDGSFFNSQDRTSRRVEWLNAYSLTPASASAHLFKFGAGASFESVDGVSTSGPVAIVDAGGRLLQNISFAGSGAFNRDRVTVSAYAQDAWTVGPRLTMLYGLRADRDSATGDTRVAPRISFTALASADGGTIVRGGVGLFQSPVPLNVLAFDQLQDRIVRDLVDGSDAFRTIENRLASHIRMGRSVNWDLQLDREWLPNVYVRIGYRQREGRFEPILHAGDPGADTIELRTDGQSSYREGQVTARYAFHGSDQIVASYTRSSSKGDLNSFNSYFGNVYNPIVPANERGSLPWDAPNRFLIWGSFGLPRGFDLFPVLDVRDGFPLSTTDALREFVGPRNASGRFPTFVSLDVQVTKRIRILGHNQTVGLKIFNITDHFNPRDYFSNLDGIRFGAFANGVGRTFRAKWVVDF